MLTDVDWMQLHLDTLYRRDARGRITRCNESDGLPAPRFHLGRTAHGNIWRMRVDLSDEVATTLSRLAAREGVREGSAGESGPPAERAGAFVAGLERDGPVTQVWRGPAFRFPDALASPPRPLPADARVAAIGLGELALTARHFGWLDAAQLSTRQPCVAVVVADEAVSLCHSARGEAAVAVEAGLDTVEAQRGRGLAAHAVCTWSAAVRAAGGTPLYSTSWQNRSSRAVARKLALIAYGEDHHFA